MELQNLNELRYVIKLTQDKGKGYISPCYFVDHWPNPELLVRDQDSSIDIYDAVYYSSTIVDAKTYTSFIAAREDALFLTNTRAWTGKVVAISAKVFFKARLVG